MLGGWASAFVISSWGFCRLPRISSTNAFDILVAGLLLVREIAQETV
jgi:hypothetical protein